MTYTSIRSLAVKLVQPGKRHIEGAGFLVHRPFPTGSLQDFDPFLLLDEMGPSMYGPNEAAGAPGMVFSMYQAEANEEVHSNNTYIYRPPS